MGNYSVMIQALIGVVSCNYEVQFYILAEQEDNSIIYIYSLQIMPTFLNCMNLPGELLMYQFMVAAVNTYRSYQSKQMCAVFLFRITKITSHDDL